MKRMMKPQPPAPPNALHHVALEVDDLRESIQFYRKVLLLTDANMSESVKNNGIHWFQLSDSQMLHLAPRSETPVFDRSHVAIAVNSVSEWRHWLKQHNVELVEPRVNLCQITRQFFRDPSGNLLELVEADSFPY